MSELVDLCDAARTQRDRLDCATSAVVELHRRTDGVAQQLAALGGTRAAEAMAFAARSRLTSVREHLAQAQRMLDEFIGDCESAVGGSGASDTASAGGDVAVVSRAADDSAVREKTDGHIAQYLDSRPWLASCDGQSDSVRRVLVEIDRGEGHALERHEGWATDERLQARVRGLEDPAQTDPDKRALGIDAYKSDRPLSHVCSRMATAIQDPEAFATAYSRGVEHPDVRAALDSDPNGARPSRVRIPIVELLGDDGGRHCAGYRLQPIDRSLGAARRQRKQWIRARSDDAIPTVHEPIVGPIRSFEGGTVAFAFGRETDGSWGVQTMYVEPPSE